MLGVAHPTPASETGTYKLWALSAGLARRTNAYTHGARVEKFPLALEMSCETTGCSGSSDQSSSFAYALIGRFVWGDNSDPSTSMSNEYDENSTADVVEAASLASVYINENGNSAEEGSSSYSVLGYCGSLNYSTFIGGYWASNEWTNGFCLGNDINGEPNIGVPPLSLNTTTGQGAMLGISTNLFGIPTINPGWMTGRCLDEGFDLHGALDDPCDGGLPSLRF